MKPLKLLLLALITVATISVGAAPPKTAPILSSTKTAVKAAPGTFAAVEYIYTTQIGVREATGRNDGRVVEMYLKSCGIGKGNPWCAAFVKWCYDQAGVKTTINAAAASAHRPKNLVYANHKLIKEPSPGDAFTLYYVKLGRIGHTGFYHRRLNSTVYQSVEGNTNEAGSREGDGVYKKYRSFNATYSISRWVQSTTAVSQPHFSSNIPYLSSYSMAAA